MKTTETTELDWAKLSRIARRLAHKNEDVAQAILLHVLQRKPTSEAQAVSMLRSARKSAWLKHQQGKTLGDDVLRLSDHCIDDGAQYRHGLDRTLADFVLCYADDANGKLTDDLTIRRVLERRREDKPIATYAEVSALLRKIERLAIEARSAPVPDVIVRKEHKTRTYQPMPERLPRQPQTELAGRWIARERRRTGIQTGFKNIVARNWTNDKPAPQIRDMSAFEQAQKRAASAERDVPIVTTSKPIRPIRFYRGKKNLRKHWRTLHAITSKQGPQAKPSQPTRLEFASLAWSKYEDELGHQLAKYDYRKLVANR